MQYVYGFAKVRLGDIADVKIGEFVRKDKQDKNGQYPVYNGGTTFTGHFGDYNMTKNHVIISARGNAGFVNFIKTNYWAGNSCYSLITNNLVLDKYLYYYLKSTEQDLMNKKTEGGIPAVSKSQVLDVVIPLPSLEEQKKIVGILDNFDKLCNDICTGLPSEIEARRKQYEHYRNQLLDFKK